MERETIERLAMDRALGELDADTTALFETYLADHTEAQVWAQAMSQACGRTREAIHRRTQTVASVPHIPTAIAMPLAWGAPARWAAVILISLSLGATAGRWSRPETSPAKTVVVRTPPSRSAEGWRQILSQPDRGFWEAKAVAMLQPRAETTPDVRGSRRGLWDRYRQSTKELNYE